MPYLLRSTLWLGFFGAILLAWVWMYFMAMNMDLDLLGRPGPIAQGLAELDPWIPLCVPMTSFGHLFAMWAIMMAAMMLPTMVPALTTYENLITSADGSWAGWGGIVLGYAIIWGVFSLLMTGVQLALVYSGVVDMLGIGARWFAVFLLIMAGAYQFTQAKMTCQTACLSPLSFFLGRWKTGFDGGLRMGLEMGLFCVGCCWAIMCLAFVGGVMSMAFMALATLFMIFEKLPQIGQHLTKPAGAILIASGIALAVWPF